MRPLGAGLPLLTDFWLNKCCDGNVSKIWPRFYRQTFPYAGRYPPSRAFFCVMYSPCFVTPYHRVPGQWYTPEFVLTQTFTSGFPARSVCADAVFSLGEGAGAVVSTDWQSDPHAFPYAGRSPSRIAAHSPMYFPCFVFPYQRVPGQW
jgi:hypothetical protein